MPEKSDSNLATAGWPEIVRQVRARTPARLLAGRAGAAYRTDTQLELREAHAAARDAVQAELNMQSMFGNDFCERWRLFEVTTQARSKEEFLLRPDLGRHFDGATRLEISNRCPKGCDFQVAIGDGLSATAVAVQVPGLLPLLDQEAKLRGWRMGQPFVIRYCRVGILNEIGDLLEPGVVVLLIGERPGLATAESLSSYMAYKPDSTHTDANRNLISNIHARGLSTKEAADRILLAAEAMRVNRLSGCNLRIEHRGPLPPSVRQL